MPLGRAGGASRAADSRALVAATVEAFGLAGLFVLPRWPPGPRVCEDALD